MASTELANHITSICTQHGIVIGSHSRGGRAFRKRRLINIRPVASPITYAVALHEIGHILGPRQSGLRLDKEAGAWEWAKSIALVWTPSMQKKMDACLLSYVRASERRRNMKPVGSGHAIYALMSAA